MEQIRKIYRVVRWVSLVALVITVFLLLKSPTPVTPELDPAQVRQNAQAFQQKLNELATAQSQGETGAEVHFTAPEINAAITQAMGPQPANVRPQPASQPGTEATAGQGAIKSTQVSFEDDVVKGQFLTQVYGRDVYLTVAGHVGSRDGYVTFNPTEFKVGGPQRSRVPGQSGVAAQAG